MMRRSRHIITARISFVSASLYEGYGMVLAEAMGARLARW